MTITLCGYTAAAAASAVRAKSFCPAPMREWSYRWPLLRAELEQYDGDIVCLQVSNQ
jgi:mRNA deadenylase 3'-5' endonuclease subunit Ccr4